MQTRRPVSALQPGDYVISVAGRPINATVTALEDLQNGAAAVGPRGGRYTLHQPLAAASGVIRGRKVLVTSGGRPIVRTDAVAVVEVQEEW